MHGCNSLEAPAFWQGSRHGILSGTVMSKPGSGRGRQRAPLARTLSLVLLFLIFYGSTVEAVHNHGGVLLKKTAAASVSNSGGSGTTSGKLLNESDCLICQLHQQLFSGLLRAPLRVQTPLAGLAPTFATAISYLSATNATQRGRAPPLTSLA